MKKCRVVANYWYIPAGGEECHVYLCQVPKVFGECRHALAAILFA